MRYLRVVKPTSGRKKSTNEIYHITWSWLEHIEVCRQYEIFNVSPPHIWANGLLKCERLHWCVSTHVIYFCNRKSGKLLCMTKFQSGLKTQLKVEIEPAIQRNWVATGSWHSSISRHSRIMQFSSWIEENQAIVISYTVQSILQYVAVTGSEKDAPMPHKCHC